MRTSRWSLGAALALGFLLAAPVARAVTNAHGVVIMEGGQEVGPDRYVMSKDWDQVIQFYRNVYGPKTGYAWMKLAETPKVKAFHVENLKSGSKWDGLNIYETKKGVFVYVIKAEESDKESTSTRKKKEDKSSQKK